MAINGNQEATVRHSMTASALGLVAPPLPSNCHRVAVRRQ